MDPAVQMARVPARPTRLDVVLVAVLLAWGLVEVLVAHRDTARPVDVVFALGVTVPLLWRRRYPVAVLLVVAGFVVVRSFTFVPDDHGPMPFPSLLVLAFSLALHVGPVLVAAAWGVVPALLMVLLLESGYYGNGSAPEGLAILVFFVVGAWTAGRVVRRTAVLAEAEQERSEQLARERARAAVAEERARIARELHDVVAHAVSVVVVQAGAAEALVDADPAAAREHLAAVRRTGREALTEMRHLLHVLREDEATYSPQPTLPRVAELVDDTTAAGTPARLDVEGDLAGLPSGVGLCAYRLVQESLTNVRKHAPGAPTVVRIARRPDELVVEVDSEGGTSTGSADGAGHGLLGMAERVRLYGGSLSTGPRPGGFSVRATLPLEAS